MEALLPNAPPPIGKEVDLHIYVDSNHAGNKWARRSRSRFMIYNVSLINWYSKKQSTIDSILWCRVCHYESQSGNLAYHPISVEDDGHSYIWSIICLWR